MGALDAVRTWFGLPAREEQRALTAGDLYGESVPFNYGGSGGSGPIGEDQAFRLGSVYAAIRLLVDNISTLPLDAYRKLADGSRVEMSTLPLLFAQLADSGQLVPWLGRCVSSMATRGNAYGLIIDRDGYQFPTQIEWLHPSWVAPDESPGSRGGWLIKGRPYDREDILHVHRFPLAGRRTSLSPIGAFAASVGVGLASQDYASGWFDAGGFPPGTFKNTAKTVDQTEADIIKSRLLAAIRTRAPLVYGNDWDYTAIQVPPEEAQFVQTQQLTANQIAAIYGIMQPEWIGGTSGSSNTYANVEQAQIQFTTFTLRPWLVMIEHALTAVLPRAQYVKLKSDALVRADLKTRWEVNQIRLTTGTASIDEIRAQEDLPPLPNGQGSKYAVPSSTPQSQLQPGQQDPADDQNPSDKPGDQPRMRRVQ